MLSANSVVNPPRAAISCHFLLANLAVVRNPSPLRNFAFKGAPSHGYISHRYNSRQPGSPHRLARALVRKRRSDLPQPRRPEPDAESFFPRRAGFARVEKIPAAHSRHRVLRRPESHSHIDCEAHQRAAERHRSHHRRKLRHVRHRLRPRVETRRRNRHRQRRISAAIRDVETDGRARRRRAQNRQAARPILRRRRHHRRHDTAHARRLHQPRALR